MPGATKEEIDRVAKALRDMPAMEYGDFRPHAVAAGALVLDGAYDPDAAIKDLYASFPNDGTISAIEYLKTAKPRAPHCFIPPEIGDGIDAALIEGAFGARPTLAGRAALLKEVGEAVYNQLAVAWNASPRTLTPGTSPKSATTETQIKEAVDKATRKPQASNPWSKAGWNVSKQGQLVKTLGIEKASAIAVAAGCRIGSTRANPDYA